MVPLEGTPIKLAPQDDGGITRSVLGATFCESPDSDQSWSGETMKSLCNILGAEGSRTRHFEGLFHLVYFIAIMRYGPNRVPKPGRMELPDDGIA